MRTGAGTVTCDYVYSVAKETVRLVGRTDLYRTHQSMKSEETQKNIILYVYFHSHVKILTVVTHTDISEEFVILEISKFDSQGASTASWRDKRRGSGQKFICSMRTYTGGGGLGVGIIPDTVSRRAFFLHGV